MFDDTSPVFWAVPCDAWKRGHVRIKGEHVPALNYQTQAWAPENCSSAGFDLFWSTSQRKRFFTKKFFQADNNYQIKSQRDWFRPGVMAHFVHFHMIMGCFT